VFFRFPKGFVTLARKFVRIAHFNQIATMTNFIRTSLIVSSLAILGCGGDLKEKRTYPVHGRILYNGEPARYVQIELEPVNLGYGAAADGVTDREGKFELRTYSNEGPDGAVPGDYKLKVWSGGVKAQEEGGASGDSSPTITVLPGTLEIEVTIESTDNDLGDIAFP
jgi:hypothetical protein